MCQERKAGDLDFVDEAGDMGADDQSFTAVTTGAPSARGRVTVLRPEIGTILPVYVYDEYEGFIAKRFVDLNDEELTHYVDANVRALAAALRLFAPDAVIVGHEVMGPEIARRACGATGVPYTVLLHGSALEYAVKEQERYRSFAASGLGAAAAVVGGSRYMVEEAARVVPGWLDHAAVVNPGCDVELFRPVPRALDRDPVAGFVGKLIASKGVHNFLAALGATRTPSLTAVVVGYGGYERELHALRDALATGDRRAAIAATDGAVEDLRRFLDAAPETFFERAASVPVHFTGRLEHGPLSALLPTFDVLVVPSVLAEAFGMVAAEAAACGVLPIVPRHSGIGEAGAAVEEALGAPGLLTFDPEDPVRGIAAAVDRVLSIPAEERVAMGRTAMRLAHERWSWDGVAARILDVARGGTHDSVAPVLSDG